MTTPVTTLAALAKLDAGCDQVSLVKGLASEGVAALFWALALVYARLMDRRLGIMLPAPPPNSSW
jgi:hypothetical protein